MSQRTNALTIINPRKERTTENIMRLRNFKLTTTQSQELVPPLVFPW